jgi:hypothetical protein
MAAWRAERPSWSLREASSLSDSIRMCTVPPIFPLQQDLLEVDPLQATFQDESSSRWFERSLQPSVVCGGGGVLRMNTRWSAGRSQQMPSTQ